MYYCCGITEKGVMPHNEDALLIGKYVMTAGMLEKRMEPPAVADAAVWPRPFGFGHCGTFRAGGGRADTDRILSIPDPGYGG